MALGRPGRRREAGLSAGHQHPDPAALFTEAFWDERYRSKPLVWSGDANPHLVEQVADLAPGTALDVGSGEGADAIWLASRGWRVTGVDVSAVALDRAAERARAAGVAGITWQRADVLAWDPAPLQFDLVTAHFMQPPRPLREALHRRLAHAVGAGGSILIVGHHPSDMETPMPRPKLPELFFTAEEVAATLDPSEWRILLAAAPERTAVNPEGEQVTIHDAVLHAIRRHASGQHASGQPAVPAG